MLMFFRIFEFLQTLEFEWSVKWFSGVASEELGWSSGVVEWSSGVVE